MNRTLYSLGWWLATPLVAIYLLWRSRRQPEYRRHWDERWALSRPRAGPEPLLWVHAVSVGETRAAQPLVDALLARDPSWRLLLTHMTPTGRQTGEELFVRRHPGRVVQAYLPYDYAGATRRFLRAWRPRLGIVMETELWPNLCAAAASEGVPLAAVNARLSERSLRKGLRWRALMAPALASLCRVVAQTQEDARRIRELGRAEVEVAGNVKFDVTPPAQALVLGAAWRDRLGGRPVVLAASTRDGEERLLLDAFEAIRRERAERERAGTEPPAARPPLLVIVPRHPQRFDAVADEIARRGLRLARRSSAFEADAPDDVSPAASEDVSPAAAHDDSVHPAVRDADVLLGDSMGEMFAYYALADVAIVGGSLLPFGGQNLIEACAARVPVLLGQHTYNFADAAEQAIAAGAAQRVADAGAALRAALELVAEPDRREAMARSAERFAAEHRGATRRTIELLEPWLPPSGDREDGGRSG